MTTNSIYYTPIRYAPRSAANANQQVCEGLLGYEPFRQMVEDAGLDPDSPGITIRAEASGDQYGLYFFTDPSDQKFCSVHEFDGPIFDAVLFLLGQTDEMPSFDALVPKTHTSNIDDTPLHFENSPSDPQMIQNLFQLVIENQNRQAEQTTAMFDRFAQMQQAQAQAQTEQTNNIFERLSQMQQTQAEEHRHAITALAQTISQLASNMHCQNAHYYCTAPNDSNNNNTNSSTFNRDENDSKYTINSASIPLSGKKKSSTETPLLDNLNPTIQAAQTELSQIRQLLTAVQQSQLQTQQHLAQLHDLHTASQNQITQGFNNNFSAFKSLSDRNQEIFLRKLDTLANELNNDRKTTQEAIQNQTTALLKQNESYRNNELTLLNEWSNQMENTTSQALQIQNERINQALEVQNDQIKALANHYDQVQQENCEILQNTLNELNNDRQAFANALTERDLNLDNRLQNFAHQFEQLQKSIADQFQIHDNITRDLHNTSLKNQLEILNDWLANMQNTVSQLLQDQNIRVDQLLAAQTDQVLQVIQTLAVEFESLRRTTLQQLLAQNDQIQTFQTENQSLHQATQASLANLDTTHREQLGNAARAFAEQLAALQLRLQRLEEESRRGLNRADPLEAQPARQKPVPIYQIPAVWNGPQKRALSASSNQIISNGPQRERDEDEGDNNNSGSNLGHLARPPQARRNSDSNGPIYHPASHSGMWKNLGKAATSLLKKV